MMKTYSKRQLFHFSERQSRKPNVSSLVAWYELPMAPMLGNDYGVGADPFDLFDAWCGLMRTHYPSGHIPICWMVKPSGAKLEFMPRSDEDRKENFLHFYTAPELPSGEPFSWYRLAVEDQGWADRQHFSGGFVAAATGWKPLALTDFVSLDELQNRSKEMMKISLSRRR